MAFSLQSPVQHEGWAVDRIRYRVGIARSGGPGDGLVARFGDAVLYIVEPSPLTPRLLAAVETAGAAADPAAALAEQLAAVAFGGGAAGDLHFVAVAPASAGILILLRGKVRVGIDTVDGHREISGERAMTWVDEVVPPPVVRISAGPSAAAGQPAEATHTDLGAGVVPGGGFVLSTVGSETVGSETVDAPDRRADEPNASLTMVKAPGIAVDAMTQAVPRVGETSAQAAVTGVLESDDGAAFPLDRPYVIGRDPLRDETVRSAAASPIVLQDPRISRVHAYISLDTGAVLVRDALTPGGTFIAAPGASDWTEVGSAPTELPLGWSLRVGERILTYRPGRRS